jgi:membrane protease YdiL (CAAX protease family)
VIIVLTLALMVLSFPIGVYTVFFTSLSQVYAASTAVPSIYIFIGPLFQVIPFVGTIGSTFVVVSAVYAAMIVFAATQGRTFYGALKRSFADGFGAFFSNPLAVTIISIGFLTFTVLIIDTLETTGGVPVGGLSGDALSLFASLAIAPLREEFGFRVLIIGTVAFIVSVARPAGPTPRALWRPSVAYEGIENLSLPWTTLGLALAASSLAFGIVHVTSGSGWEIGKLPEAAYAGVVLGYLYIRYGFHVAVLVHWGIDYLGSVFAFFGQGVFGISWTANNAYILQQVVTVDLVGVLGLASFLVVIYLALLRFTVKRSEAPGLEV